MYVYTHTIQIYKSCFHGRTIWVLFVRRKNKSKECSLDSMWSTGFDSLQNLNLHKLLKCCHFILHTNWMWKVMFFIFKDQNNINKCVCDSLNENCTINSNKIHRKFNWFTANNIPFHSRPVAHVPESDLFGEMLQRRKSNYHLPATCFGFHLF